MLFQTERLIVRRFTPADAEGFFLLNSNPTVMKYIRPAKNRADCDAFLNENLNLYSDGSVIGRYAAVEKSTGTIVGTFSLLYLAGAVDLHIGYALLPEQWGKGYATELTRNGAVYFFANTAKAELFAITDIANEPSQQVLIKVGFHKKGETIEHGKTLALFQISREPSA